MEEGDIDRTTKEAIYKEVTKEAVKEINYTTRLSLSPIL